MIFIDSNILIDVIAPGQTWRDWSLARIKDCADQPLIVNQIVLAELASGFPTLEEALGWFAALGLEVRPLDDECAFAAGCAFRAYRQTGRDRASMLSDFLIGAHALQLEASLLTRDPGIYSRYFPDLTLITPETHP